MIISHNIMALNTQRQFQTVYGRRKKSAEKLASGFRVNRSADDAAGLAISEGMRRQINGLSQALQNTRDGVAFCHTADGALEEVSSILQRVSTLSVQSANGVYAEKDRDCIQSEVDRLLDEVDRICESTEFGGQKVFQAFTKDPWEDLSETEQIFDGLLKGRIPTVTEDIVLADGTLTADKAKGMLMGMSAWAMVCGLNERGATFVDFESSREELRSVIERLHGYAVSLADQARDIDNYKGNLVQAKSEIDKAFAATNESDRKSFFSAASLSYNHALWAGGSGSISENNTFPALMASGIYDIVDKISKSSPVTWTEPAVNFAYMPLAAVNHSGFGSSTATYKKMLAFRTFNYDAPVDFPTKKNALFAAYQHVDFEIIPPDSLSSGLWIQSGAESGEGMFIQVGELDRNRLGLQGVDVTTSAGASSSIGVTQGAIEKVSSIRGQIGASQNRLEHTINNLNNAIENTTSAESRIRDTDVADEMMRYAKENILIQAGQSMLAQANAVNQNILSLLNA